MSSIHNPSVGYATVDKKRSKRAYALTPDQIWWISVWSIPALIIAVQWFNEDLRFYSIIGFAMCIFAWKTHNGILYRNFQSDLEDRSLSGVSPDSGNPCHLGCEAELLCGRSFAGERVLHGG